MRLVCPNCSSQYEVDISLFPDEGREVQCSNCEEIWFQYPVEDEKPLRLDALADDDDIAPPARPSQRLADDEQRELAAAVQEELAARDTNVERPRSRRKIERKDEPVADDDILSQLREEIAKEGGNFEDGGPTMSSKRNLEKAAQHAGIAVDDQPGPTGRRSDVFPDDDKRASDKGKGRRSRRSDKKPKREKRPRSGNLAAALRDIDAAEKRASMGFRHGFLTAVIVVMLGSGVYMFRGDIAEAYPPAAPWLAQYDELVIQGRIQAETLYVEYRPVVQDLINQASAAVGELTSGGEPAAE